MLMAVAMLAAGFQSATAAKNAPVRMIPENFSAIAKAASPAVVNIRVEKTLKGSGAQLRQFGNQPFQGDERYNQGLEIASVEFLVIGGYRHANQPRD